jgi:hypothetical protein
MLFPGRRLCEFNGIGVRVGGHMPRLPRKPRARSKPYPPTPTLPLKGAGSRIKPSSLEEQGAGI